MAEYTPSEEDVREGYALAPFEDELPDYGDEFLGQTAGDRRAAWSRWLAEHDARVRREAERSALGGLIDAAQREHDRAPAPYRYRFEKVVSIATEYRDTHCPETEDQT